MRLLFRAVIGVVAAAGAASCSGEPPNPSQESRFLDEVLVPQILRWSNGTDPAFEFRETAASRGYQFVCLVPEYYTLNAVTEEVGPLDSYSSSFGTYVPDTYAALVVVRNRVAYASLIYLGDLGLGPDGHRSCAEARDAELLRTESMYRPAAQLKG